MINASKFTPKIKRFENAKTKLEESLMQKYVNLFFSFSDKFTKRHRQSKKKRGEKFSMQRKKEMYTSNHVTETVENVARLQSIHDILSTNKFSLIYNIYTSLAFYHHQRGKRKITLL